MFISNVIAAVNDVIEVIIVIVENDEVIHNGLVEAICFSDGKSKIAFDIEIGECRRRWDICDECTMTITARNCVDGLPCGCYD